MPDNGTGPGQDNAAAIVELSPSQATISIDEITEVTATVRNARGDILNTAVEWSSSRLDIATVDAGVGSVKGVAPGVAVISATAGGVTCNASVTVRLLETPRGR